jgi:flagellar protein FlaG
MNALDPMGVRQVDAGSTAVQGAPGAIVPATRSLAPAAGSSRALASGDSAAPLPREQAVSEAERISKELAYLAPHVTFTVDEQENQVVVRVLNPVTKELVRQIPPENLLQIRQRLDHYLGMLADETA